MATRPDLTGIRREGRGWRAYVSVRGVLRAKRYPLDTLPETMQLWRAKVREKAALRVKTHPTAPAKAVGLARDVLDYLAILKPRAMPTYDTRKQQLEDWVEALGPTRDRATVTTADVASALATWQREHAYSASTLNHRRHALAHLYRTLDPADHNPARGVSRFREPQPEPRGLSPRIVAAILDAMAPRDMPDRSSDPSRTATQLRVLATTGLPPASIGRLTAAHLATLDEGCVLVPGRRKGRGTQTSRHALTPEGVAALKIMAAVGAWGPIPSSTRLIVWRRAVARVRAEHPDWRIPADVRPYDLRHSYAELVYRATHDLALTQGLLGHADQRTTRRYAAGAIPEGESAAAARVSALWRADVEEKPAEAPEVVSLGGKPRSKRRGLLGTRGDT